MSTATGTTGSRASHGMTAPIVALIPPAPGVPLEDFPPITRSQEEAMFYAENQGYSDVLCEVSVFKDKELDVEVVELLGPQTRLVIPVRCELPFLVLQMKDLEKFCSVELKVVDEEKAVRKIVLSTKLSTTRLAPRELHMPLVLKPGIWNHVCLDLADILARAYGGSYQYCKEVIVTANVVVGRVFFEDRPYEDVELPDFLRVIDDEEEDEEEEGEE